jgi:hypothetical protein
MSCTKHFLGLEWDRHRWRRRVAGFEVLRAEEPDMWARPVFRDYVRCDKQQVCDVCGAVRHEVSCICDLATGERCALLNEWKANSSAA